MAEVAWMVSEHIHFHWINRKEGLQLFLHAREIFFFSGKGKTLK